MNATATLIEITGSEPVTVDELKTYCHVDQDEEDSLFPMMIKAAREYAEHRTGRKLVACTYDIICSVKEKIVIPVTPCLGLASVKVAGEEVTDTSLFTYTPSAVGGEPVFATFEPLDGFPDGEITLRVSVGACTEAEKQWIMVRANNWYEQRATFGIGPNFHEFHHDFVDALLDTTTHYGDF